MFQTKELAYSKTKKYETKLTRKHVSQNKDGSGSTRIKKVIESQMLRALYTLKRSLDLFYRLAFTPKFGYKNHFLNIQVKNANFRIMSPEILSVPLGLGICICNIPSK